MIKYEGAKITHSDPVKVDLIFSRRWPWEPRWSCRHPFFYIPVRNLKIARFLLVRILHHGNLDF